MTTADPDTGAPDPTRERAAEVAVPDAPAVPLTTAMVLRLAGVWATVVLGSLVLVLYGLEPLFQRRAQHALFETVSAEIRTSANEASGFYGVEPPTTAIEIGQPVGILEINRLDLQQVLVEGVTPAATADGPGHVPGTAGPGQPGNAVVVGRRTAFGGPFADLHRVQPGDPIVVTTAQGRSVYAVVSVTTESLPDAPPGGSSSAAAADPAAVEPLADGAPSGDGEGPTDPFAATAGDQLTLVTSAMGNPLNGSDATVVRAALTSVPFTPTPQNGRVASQTGRSGDRDAIAAVLVALALLGGALWGTLRLHRRLSGRTAYLVSAAPVLASTIVLAESLGRLLPAWS